MWEIINKTPFAADGGFIRNDKDGSELWVVAVKASFQIEPGGVLKICEEQLSVLDSAEYFSDPVNSSLKYEKDLLPGKPEIDLLLNASAYPKKPGDTKVETLVELGNWRKRLLVTGDRVWEKDLTGVYLSDPKPFEKIEIRYENAFGGSKKTKKAEEFFQDNPVGRGFAAKKNDLAGTKAPNLEFSWAPVINGSKKNEVAGYGALDSSWSQRAVHAGTHDAKWRKERFPLRPLDFNPAFYQAAPLDQRFKELKSGEPIYLENMTPEGELSFKLPALKFELESRLNGRKISHNTRLRTIIIEPDEKRFSMIWQGELNCQYQEQLLSYTKITYSEVEEVIYGFDS